jgi:predicted nucleic acid-binding protein
VAERPVVNASPLIFLSRSGLIDLLQLTGHEVIVPEAVANEILSRGPDDITARTTSETSWLLVVPAPPTPPQIQAWGLGEGESSVLSCGPTLMLALKPSSTTLQRGVALPLSAFR